MKKTLMVILAMVLMLSTSVTAFAEDSALTGGNTATSTITYTQDSYYVVIIPETIDGNGEYRFQAEVMNITDSQQVNIYCEEMQNNGYIELQHESGTYRAGFRFTNVQGTSCVASFTKGVFESTFAVGGEVIDGIEQAAGTYTGTATFTVSLTDIGNYSHY